MTASDRQALRARPIVLTEAVERGELTNDQARNRRRHDQAKTTHGMQAMRRGVVVRPLVRDVDLAVRLGYPVPRMIRKLIAKLDLAGKLGAVERRSHQERQSTGNGGTRVFDVVSYWLNETQALRVALEGKSPKRDSFTADAFAELSLAYDRVDAASTHERPRTRGECEGGARPCPFRRVQVSPCD